MIKEIQNKIICKTDYIGVIEEKDVEDYLVQIKALRKRDGFSNDPRITVTAYLCENKLNIVYANITDTFMNEMLRKYDDCKIA